MGPLINNGILIILVLLNGCQSSVPTSRAGTRKDLGTHDSTSKAPTSSAEKPQQEDSTDVVTASSDDSDDSDDSEARKDSGSRDRSGTRTDLGQDQSKNQAIRSASIAEVKPIISKHCLRCHNANGSNPDLSNDRSLRAAARTVVRSSGTRFNGMPKDDPQKITQQEKDVLNSWQEGGFK